MMRVWWQLFVGVWMLTAAGQAAPVRVAVLEIDSPPLGKVAALLESELGQLPNIEMLERAALQDILKEQKLQTALTAGANAERMRLAKLLKADVLIILQAQEKPVPHARLVVFEARQGLRLHLETFVPAKAATDDVKKLLPGVKTALDRFRAPRREIVAIPSFLDASLTYENNYLGSAIARLIEQNLLTRPEVLVVELEEAHSIAREAAVSGENSAARTLPLYLIGEYHFAARVENRTVSYSLEVKRGNTVLDKIKKPSVPAAEFVTSFQTDSLNLLDKAIGKAAPAIDVEVENEQLLSRATQLQLIGDKKNALELLEAALVIKPDQPLVHGNAAMLIDHLAGRPQRLSTDAPETRSILQQIEQGRAGTKLRQRALPHLESYWLAEIPQKARRFQSYYYTECRARPRDVEWQREIDVYRQNYIAMAERVLIHKAENNVQDGTLFSLRAYVTSPLIDLHPELAFEINNLRMLQTELDTDLKYAQLFSYLNPYETTQELSRHWEMYLKRKFHFSLTINPPRDDLAKAYLAHLDKVIAIAGAPQLRAAAEAHRQLMLKDMDPAQKNKPVDLVAIKRDPHEVDVIKREIPLMEILEYGQRKPFKGPHPSQWLTVTPGCDIINFQGKIFWMRTKDELTQVKTPSLVAADPLCLSKAKMTSDGRYVWILVPGKAQLLVVIDSQSDEHWKFGEADGLPPMHLNTGGAAVCAYTSGKACVAGNFDYKRRWIALASFDPQQGIKFEVINEGNRQWSPTADKKYEKDLLTEASIVKELYAIQGRQKADGPVEHRILADIGICMLLIEPETRTVKDLDNELKTPSGFSSVIQQHEDRLIGTGIVKNADGKGGGNKLVSFGFPELKTKTVGKRFDEKPWKHEGEYYLITNFNNIKISDKLDGEYRELRQEFINEPFEVRRYIQTETYGVVIHANSKLYTWERVNRKK